MPWCEGRYCRRRAKSGFHKQHPNWRRLVIVKKLGDASYVGKTGVRPKSAKLAGLNRNHVMWLWTLVLPDGNQDLALLWQFGFDGVGEEFLTVGASPGWRPCEKIEDGLPDGRHARLWRRSPDSFFSVPLL
jgi:hypothetical protein